MDNSVRYEMQFAAPASATILLKDRTYKVLKALYCVPTVKAFFTHKISTSDLRRRVQKKKKTYTLHKIR